MGSRAEQGRALVSQRIKVSPDEDFLLDISKSLDERGHDAIDALARRIRRLGDDQVKEMDKAIEGSVLARTSEAIAEAWRGALLSNPKSHIVNIASNFSRIAQDVWEMNATGALRRAMGDADAADIAVEAVTKSRAVRAEIASQLTFFAKNRRFNDRGVVVSKVDAASRAAITAKRLGLREDSVAGMSANAIGKVLRFPQEALGGADDFFKGVNYMGELHGSVQRQVLQEVRDGLITRDEMGARFADLVTEPPAALQRAAREAAMDRTFTTPPARGGVVSKITGIRAWANSSGVPFGYLVLPFVNTPARILQMTAARTPVGYLMRDVQEKLARGGREAVSAHAQIGIGTSLMFLGADYANEGMVTGVGPRDVNERRALEATGWRPNSIRVGDTYVDVSRFEPLSSWLTLGASFQEILANSDYGEQDADIAAQASHIALAIGNAALSKTYLQGASDFVEALSGNEYEQETYVPRLLSTFVPAGVAEARRQQDPYMRDARSLIDLIRNRTPGLSDDLPVSHDLWGRPRMYQSHLGQVYDGLSPFIVRKVDPEPIDEALLELRYYPSMPSRSLSIPVASLGDSVSVSLKSRPDIYQRYVELAGNGAKVFPGRAGARDYLNEYVQTAAYKRLLPGAEPSVNGSRAYAIQRIVSLSRTAAREQVYREFRDELNAMAEREAGRIREEQARQAAEEAAALAEEVAAAQQ